MNRITMYKRSQNPNAEGAKTRRSFGKPEALYASEATNLSRHLLRTKDGCCERG